MGVTIVGAGGTFGYKTYVDTVRDARKLKLESAEKNVNPTAVEDFIRLRNRIQAAGSVLDQHIVTSQFFDVLDTLTLQNVRFQSLQFNVEEDRVATIEMRGVARSFNALAAESAAFASEKRIRRAIFSGITADKNGLVKFSLKAELLPKLLTMSATSKPLAVPATNIATSTPFASAPAPAPSTTAGTTSTATTTP